MRRAFAAGRTLLRREIEACRTELGEMGSDARGASPFRGAVGWSMAAVVWGNAVALVGRRFGHDQWITLFAVPLFGAAGAWWLCRRRGFRRSSIGLQLPRTRAVHMFLTGVTVAAALLAAGCALVGLATFGQDMRGLRTIRTVVGTAFGEELIHRGVLLTLWANTGLSARRVLLANMVTFGAWHIASAFCDGFHPWQVFWPTIGAIVFVWLRLRFRSILAPIAVHALNVVGVFKPLYACPYPFG